MKSTKGFTLIEMMVAVSIFAIVMLVATGALLSIVDANRKAQSQQTAFSNLDFALESMSRAIRVGTTFRCITGSYTNANVDQAHDCNGGGSAFAFEPFAGSPLSSNDQVVYRLNGTQIERSTTGGASNSFIPITSPEIYVEGLTFYVRGSTAGDSLQPQVLVSVWGHAGTTTRTRVEFNFH
jgi:prepilin-type N-terminal cleavage/methylation domain-containing protein